VVVDRHHEPRTTTIPWRASTRGRRLLGQLRHGDLPV
jgi:hypothetical protein